MSLEVAASLLGRSTVQPLCQGSKSPSVQNEVFGPLNLVVPSQALAGDPFVLFGQKNAPYVSQHTHSSNLRSPRRPDQTGDH